MVGMIPQDEGFELCSCGRHVPADEPCEHCLSVEDATDCSTPEALWTHVDAAYWRDTAVLVALVAMHEQQKRHHWRTLARSNLVHINRFKRQQHALVDSVIRCCAQAIETGDYQRCVEELALSGELAKAMKEGPE